MEKIKKKAFYSLAAITIICAVGIWLLGFFYISSEREKQRDFYLQKYSQTQEAVWKSVVNTHKAGMATYFDAYILKQDVVNELSVANTGDEAQKDRARKKLYKLLTPVYQKLQIRNVKQLHFQDKQNNSFLRFQQPHNFGDSLNASRPSVVMANKYLKPIFGFETGRVVSGFRNVFPIIWKTQHIGSVELSQPFDALKDALQQLDTTKEYMLMVKAEAVMPKLFKENKKFYFPSPMSSDWVLEKVGLVDDLSDNLIGMSNALKTDDAFLAMLQMPTPFAREFRFGGHEYIVSVSPIIDVEGKHTASMLGFSHAPELEAMESNYSSRLIYFSVMILLAVIIIIRFSYGKKKLNDERKRLLTVSNTMGEGMYTVDTDGRIRFINEAALDMLGLTEKEALGSIAHYLFHNHEKNMDVALEKCPIYLATYSKDKYEGVDFFRKKNGDIFSVDVISSQLKENDDIVGSVVVFRDITERLRLQEKLKELNKNLEDRVELEVSKRMETDAVFKSVFENSPEAILILDENGVFKECNPTAYKMLDCEESDIVGKRPCDISPPIQPDSGFFSENAADMFIKGALRGEIQRFEWAHTAKDGTLRLFEVMLSLIYKGETKEILSLWRDITKVKELEKDRELAQALLIQQSKLAEMGAMIGAIAHQWKQPLNAIWLMTQDAKMTYDYGEMTPEFMAKFKQNMGEQIKFMSQTVEDFRSFYKPSTNQTIFSVKTAIYAVLNLLSGQLSKDEIELKLSASDSLCVYGLESEFKQVILNIVNNAKDAIKQNSVKHGIIDIDVKQDGTNIVICIRDNAGGIDEHLLRSGKIFEPYNTTKGENGTGIGMSLSKTITEQKMRGKLEARNSEHGAEFIITILASEEGKQ